MVVCKFCSERARSGSLLCDEHGTERARQSASERSASVRFEPSLRWFLEREEVRFHVLQYHRERVPGPHIPDGVEFYPMHPVLTLLDVVLGGSEDFSLKVTHPWGNYINLRFPNLEVE